MASEELKMVVDNYESYIRRKGLHEDVIYAYIDAVRTAFIAENDIPYGLEIGRRVKTHIFNFIRANTGGSFARLEQYAQDNNCQYDIINKYYSVLLLEAPHFLHSFMLYMERYRPRVDRFYEPRQNPLRQFVDGFQALEDEQMDEMFLHCPPRVGKTQTTTNAILWHIGRNPELSNLFVTLSESGGSSFIDGLRSLATDQTYAFNEVFPEARIVDTDARNNTVDFRTKKKYKSISGKGMDSKLSGLYDANGWLVIDDPIDIQDVLNEVVLERKKVLFNSNVMTRKVGGAKIIWIGTLYSIKDIFVTRRTWLETSSEAEGIRYKAIIIPALNEKDESNFTYPDAGKGQFSTRDYKILRDNYEINNDMAGWMALYQQEPIERQGRVFSEDQFEYFDDLPNEDPLKVIGHCDPAMGGGDFTAFPIIYIYNNGDMYLADCVFDNSEPNITRPQVAAMIKKHRLKNVHFESNQGGIGYKDKVEDMLKEQGYNNGYKINITSDWAPVGTNKAQRIWDAASTIRQIKILNPQKRDKQYRMFVQNLMSFSMNMSKRAHDDAPDSLAGAVAFNEKGSGVVATRIISSPI